MGHASLAQSPGPQRRYIQDGTFAQIEARQRIANEIVRRADTVTLLRVEEVRDIHSRAQTGEFDDIFKGEK